MLSELVIIGVRKDVAVYREIQMDLIPPAHALFPTRVQIQTTAACGAACQICPHPTASPLWPNGLMSDELFDHIVDELRGRPIEYLCPYLMADPMSDRKIFDRVEQLRAALPKTHIEISTTGMYLAPKIADRLVQAPISELRISSHGITAEEYAKTMPGVDFDKAMANIERFIAEWQRVKPFKLSIVCLWGLWPAEREREIEAFWGDFGVELSKWRVIGRAQQVDLTVYGDGSADPTPYRDGRHEPPYLCRHRRDTEWLHILSDGRVTLCCMDYGQEEILGNVRENSLVDIWNGEAFRRVRAQVRGSASVDPNFLCDRCEYHVSESVYERCEKEPAY